jgi:hypothetical protein
MATVTITEILGSDNIAGSRITINDNFKKLANSINTLETYLDTSFSPGSALNVGSALVKKYTRPITDQIFTCEATGLFGGNLNVGQDLGVSRDLAVSRNTTISGNVTLDGTVGVGSIMTSSIPISQDASFISPQYYQPTSANGLNINPQTLTTPTSTSATRDIVTTTTFKKVSVIRLDFSTFTGAGSTNCQTINLPAVTDTNVANGQLITVMVDYPAALGVNAFDLGIDVTNLDSCYTSVLFNDYSGASVGSDDTRIRQAAITFFADAGGWRILHSVGATVVIA